MREAQPFLSRDEISSQLEIAKQLRAAFLHDSLRAVTNSARAVGSRRMFAGARYVFAIAATVVVGLGLKFYFFAPPVAEAEVVGMDIATMQATASPNMPSQELNDTAFGE